MTAAPVLVQSLLTHDGHLYTGDCLSARRRMLRLENSIPIRDKNTSGHTFAHLVLELRQLENTLRRCRGPTLSLPARTSSLHVSLVTENNDDRETGRAGEDLDATGTEGGKITCVSCSKKPHEIGDRAMFRACVDRDRRLFHLSPAVQQFLATCTIISRRPSDGRQTQSTIKANSP